jgi:hypothetical protein
MHTFGQSASVKRDVNKLLQKYQIDSPFKQNCLVGYCKISSQKVQPIVLSTPKVTRNRLQWISMWHEVAAWKLSNLFCLYFYFLMAPFLPLQNWDCGFLGLRMLFKNPCGHPWQQGFQQNREFLGQQTLVWSFCHFKVD